MEVLFISFVVSRTNEMKKELPMSILATVCEAIQQVLTVDAKRLARETGFTQRTSRLPGEVFAQAVILGSLSQPHPTLEDFAQTAGLGGHPVSPQAIDQRFTPQAAQFLQRILGQAVQQVIAAQPVAVELLQRFRAVLIQDSTTVALPDVFRDHWPGSGNPTPTLTPDPAGIKFQVRLDLKTGQLTGPFPASGKTTDHRASIQQDLPEAGSLRIADLGYFDLSVFERFEQNGVFWLSRFFPGTRLLDQQGKPLHLLKMLEQVPCEIVDRMIRLGASKQLNCRLVALKVPLRIKRLRQKRLKKSYRRRGKVLPRERLRLCGWNLYLTNLPVDRCSSSEIQVLVRSRWQIELLFKLWKSEGFLDQSRSEKPWRVLGELWAKMTAMVIQHWILIVSCWSTKNRSLTKASKIVRKSAVLLAIHLEDQAVLERSLEIIGRSLQKTARISRRKNRPNTHQLLENPQQFQANSLP
jgi:hypothetical protein